MKLLVSNVSATHCILRHWMMRMVKMGRALQQQDGSRRERQAWTATQNRVPAKDRE
jgi:hypothetical protein